jgi:HK97 family phage major capsid protein
VQLGVAGDGGNVVGPEWDRQINSVAFAYSPMRQIARVVRAASGQWQTVIASTGVSAQIIATDVTTRTDSTTPAFQKVAPPGCGLSACAPLTSWILDDAVGTSGYDLERFIFESIGQQFAVAEGALFINGTGTSQPRGLLAGTAPTEEADSARAFGTLQFTKSGVAATLGTNLDPVISALYSLKPAYRAKASFLMAPGTLQVLRQMKDGQNRYLWEPAPKAGEPSTLLGVPVFEDPNMDAIGANKFPIAVGDFTTGYCIVDAGTPRFVRDDVSSKGLVKIYMERRVHGSVCDSNAIRLVKCAA